MTRSLGCVWVLICALIMAGCSNVESTPGQDYDGGDVDAWLDPSVDAGPPPDTGPPPDPCGGDMASGAILAGCNGGFAGEVMADGPGGSCSPGNDSMPQGSCNDPRAVCIGNMTATGHYCRAICDPPATEVGSSTCAPGHRYFRFESAPGEYYGLCFRDCDMDHPCPAGFMCQEEGRCIEMP